MAQPASAQERFGLLSSGQVAPESALMQAPVQWSQHRSPEAHVLGPHCAGPPSPPRTAQYAVTHAPARQSQCAHPVDPSGQTTQVVGRKPRQSAASRQPPPSPAPLELLSLPELLPPELPPLELLDAASPAPPSPSENSCPPQPPSPAVTSQAASTRPVVANGLMVHLGHQRSARSLSAKGSLETVCGGVMFARRQLYLSRTEERRPHECVELSLGRP